MRPHASDLVIGISLIVVGVSLLGSVLGIWEGVVDVVAWSAVGVLGASVAARGWKMRSSARLFAGAFLFLAGCHAALWTSGVLQPNGEEAIASVCLWVGLSFFFVWLAAPHKLDILVPAALFVGPGIGYYIWWWDLARLSAIRDFAEDGWPALVILAGAGGVGRALWGRKRLPES